LELWPRLCLSVQLPRRISPSVDPSIWGQWSAFRLFTTRHPTSRLMALPSSSAPTGPANSVVATYTSHPLSPLLTLTPIVLSMPPTCAYTVPRASASASIDSLSCTENVLSRSYWLVTSLLTQVHRMLYLKMTLMLHLKEKKMPNYGLSPLPTATSWPNTSLTAFHNLMG
jgi:hypothetical protein